MTCARSGASWIDGSRRLIPSLSLRPEATMLRGDWRPFLVSGYSTPRRLLRPLAMRRALLEAAISRPGSGLSRAKPVPEAGPGCSASQAREQIPAHVAGPRCSGGAAVARQDRGLAGQLATRIERAGASEHHDRRTGQ